MCTSGMTASPCQVVLFMKGNPDMPQRLRCNRMRQTVFDECTKVEPCRKDHWSMFGENFLHDFAWNLRWLITVTVFLLRFFLPQGPSKTFFSLQSFERLKASLPKVWLLSGRGPGSAGLRNASLRRSAPKCWGLGGRRLYGLCLRGRAWEPQGVRLLVLLRRSGGFMFSHCSLNHSMCVCSTSSSYYLRCALRLKYPEVREGVKKFSDWPTIPQFLDSKEEHLEIGRFKFNHWKFRSFC